MKWNADTLCLFQPTMWWLVTKPKLDTIDLVLTTMFFKWISYSDSCVLWCTWWRSTCYGVVCNIWFSTGLTNKYVIIRGWETLDKVHTLKREYISNLVPLRLVQDKCKTHVFFLQRLLPAHWSKLRNSTPWYGCIHQHMVDLSWIQLPDLIPEQKAQETM